MLMNLIRRVMRQSVDTSTPGVQVQVESLADEIHREVEVLEQYGMSACPPDDVPEGLALFLGGQSDHGVVLGWFDRLHRPKDLKPGEVIWYSSHGQSLFFDDQGQVTLKDKSGSQILLASDGSISIVPSNGKLSIAADVTISGSVTAGGNMAASGNVTAGGDVSTGSISLQRHVHGGVRTGSGSTLGPQ